MFAAGDFYCARAVPAPAGRRSGVPARTCDRTAAGRFAALSDRQGSGFPAIDNKKISAPGAACSSRQPLASAENEMSTLLKNKSLLLLPIGLAILIVIGILTS